MDCFIISLPLTSAGGKFSQLKIISPYYSPSNIDIIERNLLQKNENRNKVSHVYRIGFTFLIALRHNCWPVFGFLPHELSGRPSFLRGSTLGKRVLKTCIASIFEFIRLAVNLARLVDIELLKKLRPC